MAMVLINITLISSRIYLATRTLRKQVILTTGTLVKCHMYPFSYQSTALVEATASELFEFVDDHARLSSHMSKPSWMMAGGTMAIESDSEKGKAVGSKLILRGTVLGIGLSVEERVTERWPPYRKVWETVGQPALLIIGPYQMGFQISPAGHQISLSVFINYSLPSIWWQRPLGLLFAKAYARWCTQRMANDATKRFSNPATNPFNSTTTKRA